ncbi:MAG: PAS domain-containing protein [Ardenticatenaceae bacterium]|nr:PAS domain-containing protein [Ardenticatenaceae bacterium]
MKKFLSRLGQWLESPLIVDPIERRMAVLLQVMLLGLMGILLLAAVLNVFVAEDIDWQTVWSQTAVFLLTIALPLALLRLGYFRPAVILIIGLFFALTTLAIFNATLRAVAETLSFFTLALILAGLLLTRRLLVLTFLASSGVVLISAVLEQRVGLGSDGLVVALNFMLLNGLISLFVDRFSGTLRTALQDILQSEARNRVLLNVIPDVMFEFDAAGTFLAYMPPTGFEPLLPPNTFLGHKIGDLFPAAVAEQTIEAIGRTLHTGHTESFEYQLTGPNGRQQYEARLVVSGANTVLCIVREITARKEAEAERERLIAELEAKNSELERFAYTVSHDLKSPLVTISGFLGFLEKDFVAGNEARFRQDKQRIQEAISRMGLLLDELLELSRIGRLLNTLQPVAFATLVADALQLVEGRVQATGARVQVQPDLPDVYGDRHRLEEVLQNLLDNAAKAVQGRPDAHIEIGQAGEENGKPIFFVRDNGRGISAQHHEHIFGLFNKLDANSEGTGIGLALVKRIVEVHNGRIWVESDVGQGATFYFTLPTRADNFHEAR